ncbi:hypothetical protein IFR05_008396 [Cadophora sp. M221]|nr:hypothetical protein IFR05_008396 [Cadophora sp. M221]
MKDNSELADGATSSGVYVYKPNQQLPSRIYIHSYHSPSLAQNSRIRARDSGLRCQRQSAITYLQVIHDRETVAVSSAPLEFSFLFNVSIFKDTLGRHGSELAGGSSTSIMFILEPSLKKLCDKHGLAAYITSNRQHACKLYLPQPW